MTNEDQNNADNQYKTALNYFSGIDVEMDYAEAVKWFLKAANQGHIGAMAILVECYRYGYGVEKDEAKEQEWTEKFSAKQEEDNNRPKTARLMTENELNAMLSMFEDD